MSLFKKASEKSLHEAHAAAHALGQNALSLFHQLAADLDRAANEHLAVVVEAGDKIAVLDELRLSTAEAATEAQRKAEAIKSLVS